MKLSRKAKRCDDSVIPGDFQGYEAFREGELEQEGVLQGEILHSGGRVQVRQLSLEWLPGRKPSFATLKARAEQLARAITYLDERLEIVDHDRRGMSIQLRSLPPYKDDQQIQFNEIRIGRDRADLQRIAFCRHEEVKRQVPLELTQEVLGRLMSDLRQVLGQD
jgi:hypothetical protein